MTTMIRLALLLALVLVAAGCTALEPADCRKADLRAYGEAMTQRISAYIRQTDLVAATPHARIDESLQQLAAIQAEAEALTVPGCVADVDQRVLDAMQTQQRAFQDRRDQQGSEADIAARLKQGREAMVSAANDLSIIREGFVPSKP